MLFCFVLILLKFDMVYNYFFVTSSQIQTNSTIFHTVLIWCSLYQKSLQWFFVLSCCDTRHQKFSLHFVLINQVGVRDLASVFIQTSHRVDKSPYKCSSRSAEWIVMRRDSLGGRKCQQQEKISRISSQVCSALEDTLPEAQTPFEVGELWGKNAHITVKSLTVIVFYYLKYSNSLHYTFCK